ncbi:MAG: restriction endonuclease [Gemmataceae bacterium]|nr:restriction endonuclease [Gemmataceae bacterium]
MIGLDRISSWQVEKARAEFVRLEAIWIPYRCEQVDPITVAKQRASVRQLAAECQQRSSTLRAREEELRQREVAAKKLRRSMQLWEVWRSSSAPIIIGCIGLDVSILIGLILRMLIDWVLGIFLGFVIICLASLSIVGWYCSTNDWIEKRITTVTTGLAQVEQQRNEAAGWVVSASSAYNNSRKKWEEADCCYQRMLSVHKLQQQYEQAKQYYDDLLQIIQSARYQLLHADWRSMRGTDFEAFLRKVFEMLGYTVQSTKASGDQGIDLILMRSGRRIGVQAKGYEKNVGNGAVQEAYAGMGYYGCDSCVVITNSGFTRHAKDLASRLGCRLIDGYALPALIAGNLTL